MFALLVATDTRGAHDGSKLSDAVSRFQRKRSDSVGKSAKRPRTTAWREAAEQCVGSCPLDIAMYHTGRACLRADDGMTDRLLRQILDTGSATARPETPLARVKGKAE